MMGQLDRLLTLLSLPRISLGIVPARAPYRVPTNQFTIFDDKVVYVDNVSAELIITQPREVVLYLKAFQETSKSAVYGHAAKAMVSEALETTRASMGGE